MPIQLWGASELKMSMPDRPIAYVLLFIYLSVLAYFLYQKRNDFRSLSRRDMLILAILATAGFAFSQLFPIRLSSSANWLAWLVPPGEPIVLTLLLAVPLLLAAYVYGAAAAVPVGIATGLGVALGQTHSLFTPFHLALATAVAGWLCRQPYRERIYHWLRLPPIAAIAGLFTTLPLALLSTWASWPGGGLAALDVALAASHAQLLPMLLAGAVGGGIVLLIAPSLATAWPRPNLTPSPQARSLRLNLLTLFGLYAGGVTLLVLTAVYGLLTTVSTRLTLAQMSADAATVVADIPAFRSHLQELVAAYPASSDLLLADRAARTAKLGEMQRLAPDYTALLLVDSSLSVVAQPSDTPIALTVAEETAVTRSFTSAPSAATFVTNTDPADPAILSFIVPLDDTPNTLLIGRIPATTMQTLISGMQNTIGQGIGFIVDNNSAIIAHPDSNQLRQTWALPTTARPLATDNGRSYLLRTSPEGPRELVYTVQQPATDWTVVIAVPYTSVLAMALQIGGPLALILLALTAAAAVAVNKVSRTITAPMQDLTSAARVVASGGNWNTPSDIGRDDEIGQLNRAFTQMQRSLKQRLNELTLLLSVSHDVSANLNLKDSMSALLRGALRGTGAAGARIVVASPSGGKYLSFGEGPAAERMAALDKRLTQKIRSLPEMALHSPTDILAELELTEQHLLPVRAVLAMPLKAHDRFQGVIWLGYAQAHSMDTAERNLLQTLASQAVMVAEKSRHYTSAESGRRRLTAVLSSTADAVVVTDQTDKILLVNPALAELFELDESRVTGRHVRDVLPHGALIDLLQVKQPAVSNPEITLDNGRVFHASVSTIVSPEGMVLGRVGVLHDITRYKEIDEMKSNFVADVSHDLRSPLTFMRGYATMMPMVGTLNDQQHEYLDRIMVGIDQMSSLVEDLLDLARIEAAVELNTEPIHTSHLLDSIAEEYWQHAHLSGNSLEVRVDDDTPATITGDPTLVRRAITNLLGNAFKYAPNSGIIDLRARRSDTHIIFSVNDNGPGISADKQKRLFEKFYRVQEKGTERVKGTGLGLAIVKSIAERHGGWVKVESEIGRGTTFYLALPITAPSFNGHHGHFPTN